MICWIRKSVFSFEKNKDVLFFDKLSENRWRSIVFSIVLTCTYHSSPDQFIQKQIGVSIYTYHLLHLSYLTKGSNIPGNDGMNPPRKMMTRRIRLWRTAAEKIPWKMDDFKESMMIIIAELDCFFFAFHSPESQMNDFTHHTVIE